MDFLLVLSHCVCSRLPPAFGGRIQQPLVVVLVATHADLADIPRAFSGEFTYDKEKVLLKEVRNRLEPEHIPEGYGNHLIVYVFQIFFFLQGDLATDSL